MPKLNLTVNGRNWSGDIRPGASLLEVVRDQLGLTGTKYGCGEGQCGSCTVLLDGRAVRACVTPAVTASRKPVTTIEGLAKDGRLHALQESFIEKQAFQCGFCTPGMILGAKALLDAKPQADEPEIRTTLQGQICRCGAYPRIVEAVRAAGAVMAREAGRG